MTQPGWWLPDWEEDFGQRYAKNNEEIQEIADRLMKVTRKDLDNCVGMVNGKPVWREVKENEDGSFSPIMEEEGMSAEDQQFLADLKVKWEE